MRCCRAVELNHKCVDEVSLEGREIKNTIVITFGFQVVFTAFNALQNLHSSLHDEESLGNISLAILYGTAILSSVLSPTVIGLIGAKSAIVASFAAHCIYVLANFYPSFSTMAPAAVALGAFHGPAWTSQALYISASAFSFSKSSSASPYTILSRFNGFFFAVFATAQIVGNLVTSTIIRDGVGNDTDTLVTFCGPDDCPHHVNATVIEDPEEWVLDITLGFFMACTLLGLFLVIFLLTPLPRSEWIQRVSVRETATSCFKVLVTPNMLLLVPLIIFTAVEHAFLMSAYTKSYVACPIGIHMVGYVMAVYGVTTPAFVYIFSHLARIAGRFLLLMISLLTHIFLFIVLFRWSPTADDKAVIFIIPTVWGVSESILQAQANALIAMLFPSQKEPAFANFHAWRSLGYAITFLNASYLCVSTKLIVCMTFAGLGTLLYIVVEFKSKIKQKLAFRKARPSIISIPSEARLKLETAKGVVMVSHPSVQDHLCFDRVELADIIMEAQQGWKRDEKGLTLQVSKVMSLEHLAGSKATNWYHTGPLVYGHVDTPEAKRDSQKALPRSLSDGHLLYAAEKVDAELNKIRRERIHTVGGHEKSKAGLTASKRNIPDIVPRPIDVIPEDAYEDEFTIEDETNSEYYDNVEKYGSVFENDNDDDIDENESKEIMQYRKVIRRLSETLTNENIPSKIREHHENPEMYCGHENPIFEYDDGEMYMGGDIVFTDGLTSAATNGVCNTAFESDDNAKMIGAQGTNLSNGKRAVRLSSNDHGYFSENIEDNSSFTSDSNNTADAKSTTGIHSPHKKRKGKILNVFKIIGKSKKTNKDNDCTDVPVVKVNDMENGEFNKGDDSDADSDGFVDNEFEDNKSYVTSDFVDMDRSRRKAFIPVSPTEDVTCIY